MRDLERVRRVDPVSSVRREPEDRRDVAMPTVGFNHVAIITKDADRLLDSYASVFGAEKSVELVDGPPDRQLRLMIIDVGPLGRRCGSGVDKVRSGFS